MDFNKETIPHYRSEMIPLEKLKKLVLLNSSYLREKPTWYMIDDVPQYFKVRNDFRIFTELFFSRFATQIMGLEALTYQIACIRTINPNEPTSKEETKYGLLSKTFQDLNYNHYLASEIMDPKISDFVFYNNGYSLKSFLNYFKNTLSQEDYERNRLFLIKLFIADAFTYQVDRNPNNIAFQIPKIDGVSYKNRLRIEKIKRLEEAKKLLTIENGIVKLVGLTPNCIYDSERSLGIDHKNGMKFNSEECWFPNFPYSEDLLFINGEEAKEVSDNVFDGLDPNLVSLYIDYPEICKPFFERLAYDSEYRKILEEFMSKPCPVWLNDNQFEYVDNVLKERQKVFQKVLKY